MKNLIGIIVVIILGIGAYFLLKSEEKTTPTSTEVFDDFAIKDTSSIDQIFIAHPNDKKVLLSRRESGKWMVNGEFPARLDAIRLLLKTARNITVRSPVSQKTFDGVVKSLATKAIKVEFYQGEDKPVKTWYVGHGTANRVGTYMLLEKDETKSAKPFVMHLIMERGTLGSRFFASKHLWKNPVVLATDPKKIKSIKVEHRSDTMPSFQINQIDTSKFEILDLDESTSSPLDARVAIAYFKSFNKVFYEYIDRKTDIEKLDSVYTSPFRHRVTIERDQQPTIVLRTYDLPVPPETYVGDKLVTSNPERMYIYSSELGQEIHPIVQNFSFDRLVPSIKAFKSLTTVEK